jgi:hypothetical protein
MKNVLAPEISPIHRKSRPRKGADFSDPEVAAQHEEKDHAIAKPINDLEKADQILFRHRFGQDPNSYWLWARKYDVLGQGGLYSRATTGKIARRAGIVPPLPPTAKFDCQGSSVNSASVLLIISYVFGFVRMR